MKAILIAGVLAALIPAGIVWADDPNPDVAKAIQEIAARRAEKEEARAKQAEQWAKNEARERGWGAAAPGAGIKKDDTKK